MGNDYYSTELWFYYIVMRRDICLLYNTCSAFLLLLWSWEPFTSAFYSFSPPVHSISGCVAMWLYGLFPFFLSFSYKETLSCFLVVPFEALFTEPAYPCFGIVNMLGRFTFVSHKLYVQVPLGSCCHHEEISFALHGFRLHGPTNIWVNFNVGESFYQLPNSRWFFCFECI